MGDTYLFKTQPHSVATAIMFSCPAITLIEVYFRASLVDNSYCHAMLQRHNIHAIYELIIISLPKMGPSSGQPFIRKLELGSGTPVPLLVARGGTACKVWYRYNVNVRGICIVLHIRTVHMWDNCKCNSIQPRSALPVLHYSTPQEGCVGTIFRVGVTVLMNLSCIFYLPACLYLRRHIYSVCWIVSAWC